MMINLNLIPEEYKKNLRRLHLSELSKRLLIFVMLYTILIAIVLLLARLVLQREFTRIVNETTLVTRENKKVEGQIRLLNEQITTASKLETDTKPWSQFLVLFTSRVPDGIRLTSLDLKTTGESTVSGVAATRESLLELKTRLTAMPGLESVELPVSSLLTRDNIDFTIRFRVNPTLAVSQATPTP